MASQTLDTLIVESPSKHAASIIFIHGLGDSGYGWRPVADMLKRDEDLSHVKWILPHAPARAVTANGGAVMPAWFDIKQFGIQGNEDREGMMSTVQSINQLVQAEIDVGIPADRIVIGGFSQGAAMTILTGLTTERRVAGLVVLSGRAPIRDKIKETLSTHAKQLPIFWGHGTDDQMVKYQFGLDSIEFLKKELGIQEAEALGRSGISFHSYPGMGHSTTPKELDDLKQWLKKVLPEDAA